MTLLTWMKMMNAIKVFHGSKTKREKKKKEKRASGSERKESSSKLNKAQGLKKGEKARFELEREIKYLRVESSGLDKA